MRIERVKQQLKREPGSSQNDDRLGRTAAELIANRDKASADFIKHYYNVDWHDPQLYHMILNLGKLNVEQSAQIIVAAVRNLEM